MRGSAHDPLIREFTIGSSGLVMGDPFPTAAGILGRVRRPEPSGRQVYGARMSTAPGIAGVFDRAADSYDAVGVPWFGPIAQGLVEELAVRPGERVLDVGCGRGAALLPLAQATGPGGHALGMDLAPRWSSDRRRRRRDAVGRGAGRRRRVTGRAGRLVRRRVLLPRAVLPARSRRGGACPGRGPGSRGRLGVTTFGAQEDRWEQVDAVFAPYLPQAMKDARTSGASGPFASDAGVEELLTSAGLVDVRTAHRTVHARFADPQQWLDFTWSHGQRAMWESVPADQHDEVREAAFAVLAEWDDLTFSQDVRHTLGRRP
jgi:SAM-dependent methyltransferase